MKVITTVHVRSEDGRHTAVLQPGDTVPDWATVTNPAAVEADAQTLPAPAAEDEESTPPAAEEKPAEAAPKPARRTTAKKASE